MQFKVKVLDAILTHDTQIGSKMDPFCVLKVGKQTQKTKILDEAGDWPIWNQEFTFETGARTETLRLVIYDEDMAVDDLVGQVTINVSDIISKPKTEVKWYSLKYGPQLKRPAGKIHLQFECVGGGNFNHNQPQYAQQMLNSSNPNIQHGYGQGYNANINNINPNLYSQNANQNIYHNQHIQQNQPIHSQPNNTQRPTSGLYSPLIMNQNPQTYNTNQQVHSSQSQIIRQAPVNISQQQSLPQQNQAHYRPSHQSTFGVSQSASFGQSPSVQHSNHHTQRVNHPVTYLPQSQISGQRSPQMNSSLNNQTPRIY